MTRRNVRNLGGTPIIVDIPDVPVVNADLADMAATTVKARGTASTGPPEDIAIGTGITLDATSLRLASMVQNTIKGRVTASTGAPEDLTADQAAAVLRSGTGNQGVLQSKVITFTRDLTAATGNVAYTGVGFKPTCLIMLAFVNATATHAVGFGASDGSSAIMDFYGNSLVTGGTSGIMQIQLADGSAAKYQFGQILSFDSDGFTLSWTKNGLPTGLATVMVLCLR